MKIGEHGRLTADQARSEAKTLLGAVEKGHDPIAQRQADRKAKPFRELAEEHFNHEVKSKLKPRTQDEYRRLLDLHILPELGSKIGRDLRRVDVSRLHAKMRETPATANRAVALVSNIWNWAAGAGEVERSANPARFDSKGRDGIQRYPEAPKERYLSTKELQRLGDTLRKAETTGLPWAVDEDKPTAKHIPKVNRLTKLDLYAVAALRLLIFTGARLREILHAKWDYVDWDRGLLHLPESKTGRKTIYLAAPALAVLESLPKTNSPYIIPGLTAPRSKEADKKKRKAGTGHRADLKKPWAAVARAADLKGVRLHDLRHSFAATGAGMSLGLPMIGKLLGHSQPDTTARYAHLDADPMRRAAEIIGNQLAAAMSGNTAKIFKRK